MRRLLPTEGSRHPKPVLPAAVTRCGLGRLLATANGCLSGLNLPSWEIRRTLGRNISAVKWRGAVFLPAMLTLLA